MRLRRDSSGNYSYQFVADEDAQADAQRELDEAQNSLYNMDKEEFKTRQEEFYDTWEEYQDKMREYSELSYEERLAREEEFQLYFKDYQARLVEITQSNNEIKQNLNQSTYDALASLYRDDSEKFAALTEEEKNQLVENLQPEFVNTMNAMNTRLTGEGGYVETWQIAEEAINQANSDIQTGIDSVNTIVGDVSTTTSDYYSSAITLAQDFVTEQDNQITKYKEELGAVSQLKLEVQALKEEWEAVYTAATEALQASQMLREQRMKEEAEELARQEAEAGKGNGGSNGDNSGGGGSGGGGNEKPTLTPDVIDGIAGAIWYHSPAAWGNGDERKTKINQKFGKGSYKKVQDYIDQHVSGSTLVKNFKYGWKDRDKYKNYYYSKFDTGGYTGNWNSSKGKFAMLHEKELVLNKSDTANMLKMISMVREIMGLGSQPSISNINEDKDIQHFHSQLNEMIDSVNNFKDKFLHEQKVDSLNLLQKFEELRHSLEENEEMEELLKIEEYNKNYQELLNEQRKQEIEKILNLLSHSEKVNDLTSITGKTNDILNKSLSNSLTELKHIIKDSFENKIGEIDSIFNSINERNNEVERTIDDVQQNVVININADFPGASSANEIQLAFDNLVNIASQRAYSTSALRKK
jgi:hypothetical protein